MVLNVEVISLPNPSPIEIVPFGFDESILRGEGLIGFSQEDAFILTLNMRIKSGISSNFYESENIPITIPEFVTRENIYRNNSATILLLTTVETCLLGANFTKSSSTLTLSLITNLDSIRANSMVYK